MKTNNETKTKSKTDDFSSLRVKQATKNMAMKLLENANAKDFGRKISMEDLVGLALEKMTKDDLSILQKKSLRNKDRQTIVYNLYCKKVKKVSEDEFIGITMSSDYFSFLEANKVELQF